MLNRLRVLVLLIAAVGGATDAVFLAGCHAYVMHPGAANVADSKLYDALIDVQAAIEEAKLQVAKLPALKFPLNDIVIPNYNRAYDAYIAYHEGLTKGAVPDATKEEQIRTQILGVKSALQTVLNSIKNGKQ